MIRPRTPRREELGAFLAARRRAAKLLGGLQDKVAESAARLRRQLTYADELAELLAARSAQPAATGR